MGEAFRRHHDAVQPLPKGSVSMEATDSLRSNEALHVTSSCGPLAPLPDPGRVRGGAEVHAGPGAGMTDSTTMTDTRRLCHSGLY